MSHGRSQSSDNAEPMSKRSRTEPSHAETDSYASSHLSNQVVDLSVSSAQSSDQSLDSSVSSNQPASNDIAISLSTYPFLLPLVIDCLCDRDVVARLLIVNQAIRRMTPKYVIKQMLDAFKALRLIQSSRDIIFSVTRIKDSGPDYTRRIQQANADELKEVHNKQYDIFGAITGFVTHLVLTEPNYDVPPLLPVGIIPNTVVDLELMLYTPAVRSIPQSVKRLTITTAFSDLDPAAIPTTVTDLTLQQSYAFPSAPIRYVFPASLTQLHLGPYKLPLAPGALPSSLLKLQCTNELLSKLEVGVIPDSVNEMKIDWDMRYVPNAGVIPDSVTRISMIITYISPQMDAVPLWHLPARLTNLRIQVYNDMHIHVGMVPATVTHFTCTCQVDRGALPNSITHLEMLIGDELEAGTVPQSVTHLSVGCCSMDAMFVPGSIPRSVTHLVFSCHGKQKMITGIIPSSVTHLTFQYSFNRPIPAGVIPESVTHLVFIDFNRNITRRSLPSHLTHLAFGSGFKKSIGNLIIPLSVRHLYFDGNFSCVSSPTAISHVTHLTINGQSDQTLDYHNLPCSLAHLDVPSAYLNNGKLQLPAFVTHLSYQKLAISKHPDFQSNFWHKGPMSYAFYSDLQ